jgi:hypothetical protein
MITPLANPKVAPSPDARPRPRQLQQLWFWTIPTHARDAWEAADAAGTLKRWQRATRTTIRVIAIVTIPIFAAQILAFASFIYEEALQATGYATKIAIDSRDEAIARDAVNQYRIVMEDAQRWQRRWGKWAFWSHPAYHTYFNQAAPTQLAAYYAAGIRAELWPYEITRWKVIDTPDGGRQLIDTWKLHAIAKANQTLRGPWHERADAAADGYDPLLKHPRGAAPYEDGDPNWRRKHD